MNCQTHPELPAVAYCRDCGRPLCDECKQPWEGTTYCAEHAPPREAAASSPWTSPPPASGVSPGLAFLLGLIPGVGAIYNAQYAKGLVHVVIFGLLISIVSSNAAGGLEPLFGMLIPAWIFYMAFEAYHTAKRRERGEVVDEFSSLVPLRTRRSGFPAGPVMLIALGIIFLLNNLRIIRLHQILEYWPVFLIALGTYMLYNRVTGAEEAAPGGDGGQREMSHEGR